MSKKGVAVMLIVAVIAILVGIFLYFYFIFSPGATAPEPTVDPSWNNVWQRGELLVGTNMPYGSMEFLNAQGEPDGFDMDLIKEVASRLGLKAKIIAYDWDNLFPAVKSGEIDVAVSGIGINAERGAEMFFSDPYLNAGSALIVKKDNETIKGASDLKGKKIGVQRETVLVGEALKLTDENLVMSYDNYGDAMINDLKSGKIDVILLGYEAVSGIIKNNSDLKMPCPPINDGFVAIPTKLGNKSLMSNINKVLKTMKSTGVIKSIEDKWLGVN